MESSNNGDKGKVVPLYIKRTPRIHARYLLQGHLGSMQGIYYKDT